jgi:hypothetical protein
MPKTNLYLFSTDTIFSPKNFGPWLVEFMDVEPVDLKRWLYSLEFVVIMPLRYTREMYS